MPPDDENPYAPPAAPLVPADSSLDMIYYPDASHGKRFLNLLIDYAGVIGFIMVPTFLIVFIEGIMGGAAIGQWLMSDSDSKDWITGVGGMVVYYCFFEGFFGRTPGKFITGTRVIHESGRKAGFLTILGRTLARFLPFEVFSFIGNLRGWHDRWSGTRVIDIRDKAWWEKKRLGTGMVDVPLLRRARGEAEKPAVDFHD